MGLGEGLGEGLSVEGLGVGLWVRVWVSRRGQGVKVVRVQSGEGRARQRIHAHVRSRLW